MALLISGVDTFTEGMPLSVNNAFFSAGNAVQNSLISSISAVGIPPNTSYKDPSYNDDFGIETPSALDNFTQAIQSQILGEIGRAHV